MPKINGEYVFGEVLETQQGVFTDAKGQTIQFHNLYLLVSNEDRTVDKVKVKLPVTFDSKTAFPVGSSQGVPVKATPVPGQKELSRRLREKAPVLPGEAD